MLPGLRFLFAAIVLATSLLVFGLGAAALFRAAHEEFASIPARRAPPPEPQFAQQPETPPVLAMVRVDPPAADKVTTDTPAAPSEPAASEQPAAPAEIAAPAAEPEKVAAVTADDPVPPAPPKPEAQATETPAPAQSADTAAQTPTADPSAAWEPTPAAAEAAPAATEAKVAAVADPPAPSEPALPPPAPAMAAPEPAPPPSPEAIAAATKIATLGGPEVVVEVPVAPKAAEAKKPERSAVSKPAHRKERRRIVRAPPVRQVVQQQQLDPFGQPTLVPLTRR
ncbi:MULTISPECIES: hypothetical protein [unclassified Bradyrhizobium]|uniref:hypothetical protein n=1 Tax=Bradyrhizobium sp. USDA 4541 TaxID=2817704 RepID=UPI0020A3E350|nr:hypothetical protein [Bradyrhizobium sp. USDA 4541]MCP1849357.1 hypothetical protein [Bradyrhizobium sp. USDA 4541]